jgi:hypothetical protein
MPRHRPGSKNGAVHTANRTIAILAIAGALLPAPRMAVASSSAASGAETLHASAAVDFRIDVPRVMRLRLLGHPASIEVTAEDVGRGAITISGGAVDVAANDRAGYLIRADLSGSPFSGVRIEGLASGCHAARDGCVIRMPSMVGRPAPQPMRVVYELQLDARTQPGRYAWPVALSLQQP